MDTAAQSAAPRESSAVNQSTTHLESARGQTRSLTADMNMTTSPSLSLQTRACMPTPAGAVDSTDAAPPARRAVASTPPDAASAPGSAIVGLRLSMRLAAHNETQSTAPVTATTAPTARSMSNCNSRSSFTDSAEDGELVAHAASSHRVRSRSSTASQAQRAPVTYALYELRVTLPHICTRECASESCTSAQTWCSYRRYSDFVALRSRLAHLITSDAFVCASDESLFPPRRPFTNSNSPSVVNERLRALPRWLEAVSRHPRVSVHDAFRRFLGLDAHEVELNAASRALAQPVSEPASGDDVKEGNAAPHLSPQCAADSLATCLGTADEEGEPWGRASAPFPSPAHILAEPTVTPMGMGEDPHALASPRYYEMKEAVSSAGTQTDDTDVGVPRCHACVGTDEEMTQAVPAVTLADHLDCTAHTASSAESATNVPELDRDRAPRTVPATGPTADVLSQRISCQTSADHFMCVRCASGPGMTATVTTFPSVHFERQHHTTCRICNSAACGHLQPVICSSLPCCSVPPGCSSSFHGCAAFDCCGSYSRSARWYESGAVINAACVVAGVLATLVVLSFG